MTKPQIAIYHCLACGNVVRAAPGGEPPLCCGAAMVEAAMEAASAEDVAARQAEHHCETKPPIVQGRIRPHDL